MFDGFYCYFLLGFRVAIKLDIKVDGRVLLVKCRIRRGFGIFRLGINLVKIKGLI